jgi:biotin carboxylase
VFHPVSITEVDQIVEICREVGVDGVCTIASDLATIAVNHVADALGLTGNSLDCTRLTTNKRHMRAAFAAAGDPSPRSLTVSLTPDDQDASVLALGPNQLADFDPTAHGLSYPLIVKPTDRSGSRGIFKVIDPVELQAAVAFAREPSFEKKVLIEEFAEGREYSIEYISFDACHHFLACTEKFTTGAPMFVETGHLQPPKHMDEATLAKIQKLVPQVLDSLGVRFGASHTELKVDESGNIKLIECGARMGGDCIGSDLVYLSRGIDFVQAVIDVSCGKAPELKPVREEKISAIRFIFNHQDLECFEKIKASHPEKIYRQSEIMPIDGRQISDSSTRYGFYILSADSMDEMLELLKMSGLETSYFE